MLEEFLLHLPIKQKQFSNTADRPQLFSPVELSEEDQKFRRDTAEEYDALRRVSEFVFRMALEG